MSRLTDLRERVDTLRAQAAAGQVEKDRVAKAAAELGAVPQKGETLAQAIERETKRAEAAEAEARERYDVAIVALEARVSAVEAGAG